MAVWTLAPESLGSTVMAVAEYLQSEHGQVSPLAALYCEKVGGFQCATCRHSTPVNATHGRCELVATVVNQQEGCCVMWSPDPEQLHQYREPTT